MITVALYVIAVAAITTGVGLWRLLRSQTPHPIDERRTVDWDELRGIWSFDNGSPE